MCSSNSRTVPSSTKNHVPCELILPTQIVITQYLHGQPCLGRAFHTAKHSLIQQSKKWVALDATRTSLHHIPKGCVKDISRNQENMQPLIVCCISPSIATHHLLNYAYLRCPKTERQRRTLLPPIPVFLSFPLRNHLAVGKITVFLWYE